MKVKQWMACLAALVLAGAVLTGCGNSVKTKVETVTTDQRPVALTLDANITALHMTNIVPKLSGKLGSAPLTKGQEVKAGDVVVQVDAAPYEQSVAAAESAMVQATAAAAAAAPAPSYSGGGGGGSRVDEGQRAKLDVWYKMGAISKVEYNQMMAKSAVQSAPAQEEAAPQAAPAVDTARVAQLQQTVQAARDMLGNTTIYSPIDGKVTSVAENPSVAVAGMVLATVQQMSPLVATFAVPEAYLQALQQSKQDGTISVSIITPSGEMETGELTYLATEKDSATGSYTAKITFKNEKNLFVPGEFYHVRLSSPKEVSQITVPKTAVRTKDSGDFVYVVTDAGLADARAVLTGDEEEGRVVVLSGLQEGDRVIVDPPDKMEIGMKVTT